jgi:predicted ester cyclase
MSTFSNIALKKAFLPFREAQYDFDLEKLKTLGDTLFSQDAAIKFCVPFDDMTGHREMLDKVYAPLLESVPDLERRDTIIMVGEDDKQLRWLGCCGYYTGRLEKPWLDIPATGDQIHMRFHEFYRFEGDTIVEVQAIWDLPEVMMQAKCWPFSLSLGTEWHVPGPTTQDGIHLFEEDKSLTAQSHQLVLDMLNSLGKFAEGGVAAMNLDKYWHPKSNWYGPSGIGTGRGIQGFRNTHQEAFLNGMPNRVGDPANGHLFSENNYVGFTGWPGMSMTISGDGWLGIVPNDKSITMRSLDFWRNENGMIRENWVLIDLLHVYRQLGVDVFARVKQLTRNKYR